MHTSYVAIPAVLGVVIAVILVGWNFWDSGVSVDDIRNTEFNLSIRRCSMICEQSCGDLIIERAECVSECQTFCAEAY